MKRLITALATALAIALTLTACKTIYVPVGTDTLLIVFVTPKGQGTKTTETC